MKPNTITQDRLNSPAVYPILDAIFKEVDSAKIKFPEWPADPFHALAVVGEEYGEMQKAVLEHAYETAKEVTLNDIRAEVIQTAAMCVRFLEGLQHDA